MHLSRRLDGGQAPLDDPLGTATTGRRTMTSTIWSSATLAKSRRKRLRSIALTEDVGSLPAWEQSARTALSSFRNPVTGCGRL